VQYVPRLSQPNRSLVVPLLAAALGACVATATFAIVNIEDEPTIPLPIVQTAPPPADVLAGERADGGPAEGTAQQIMRPATGLVDAQEVAPPASSIAAGAGQAYAEIRQADTAPRYDGGPNEGASVHAMAGAQPPKAATPASESRYDGGPNEGSSAAAIAQP
jgi:hypothetical protein